MCRRDPLENPFRQGQPLVTSKQLRYWDFEGVQQWANKKGMEWHLVPTGGQHFNGQAERMIGILKIVNSRPLAGGLWADGRPSIRLDVHISLKLCQVIIAIPNQPFTALA
jgi:hypothetical protein